jgi:hypothetical protein
LGEGAEKSAPTTSIDLRKSGDVALVLRAVQNEWDVPQHIKDAICDQLVPAIQSIPQDNSGRHAMKLIRLVQLMLKMEARNMIDEGVPKSSFPYIRHRKPGPEKRRPRRFDPLRAEVLRRRLKEALEKLQQGRR